VKPRRNENGNIARQSPGRRLSPVAQSDTLLEFNLHNVEVKRCIILCMSDGHGEEQGDSYPHEAVGEFHAAKHIDHVKNVSLVVYI
jgi:hypothetical protein